MADSSMYIVIIIISVIATLLILISTILYAVVSNRSNENKSRQNLLRASAALTALSIIVIIVSIILVTLLITKSKVCVKSSGINIASIIVFIILFIMVVFSLVIAFVLASQFDTEGDHENARNLRAAGFILIIAIVLYGVSYIILYVKSRQLIGILDKYGKIVCDYQKKSGTQLDTKDIKKLVEYIKNPREISDAINSGINPELISELISDSGLDIRNSYIQRGSEGSEGLWDSEDSTRKSVNIQRLIECAQRPELSLSRINQDTVMSPNKTLLPTTNTSGESISQPISEKGLVASLAKYAKSPEGKRAIMDFLTNYKK